MGGTFDPIHVVHMMVADQVCQQLKLDQVWFMPAHIPPHKEGSTVSDSLHRVKMVELAIEKIPYFELSSFELERPGPSYTIDTVLLLRKEFPECEFFFIIGGDMIDYLPNWHRIDELVHLVQFVGVHRPGYLPNNEFSEHHVIIVSMPQMELSSTYIRNHRRIGGSIRFMVTEEVERYIEENRLYES
ncbi:nicotinate-nucleotide adenylyltransferase [Ammoniphilus sp. CFH 90114]|uniref:nicotinate-nucleotide adenylyltransferase n=1 Tax=Ammoniphilus sp. CFH 90114 TaxID=2493665 RepID=UPI001F0C1BAE|nr:nicotinate-nucleotide adenylyltransferase [Ammoniphilus sp. CFH 90114]